MREDGLRRRSHRRAAWVAVVVAILVAAVVGIVYFGMALSKDRGEEALASGADSYSRGRFEESVAALEKATRLDPTDPEAHRLLGRAYEALGRLDDAEKAYETSLARDPDQPLVLHNIAVIHLSSGDFKLAERELLDAIESDENFIGARMVLAEAYETRGQRGKARNQYQAVLRLNPPTATEEIVTARLKELD